MKLLLVFCLLYSTSIISGVHKNQGLENEATEVEGSGDSMENQGVESNEAGETGENGASATSGQAGKKKKTCANGAYPVCQGKLDKLNLLYFMICLYIMVFFKLYLRLVKIMNILRNPRES